MGAILGPILGPALGGWLTDNMTWRWVFFINLPVGALALVGISLMREAYRAPQGRLDFLGFATLGLAIGSLQMMLDRGQQLDWFSSGEIRIEAILAGMFFYLFLVQTLTARQPFIRVAIFKDINFVVGCVFGFFLGLFLFSVLSVLPPMLENLLGYPVVTTGLLTAPRGVGTLISMTLVGRLIQRIDPRLMIFIGMCLSAVSMKMMSGFSLDMGSNLVLISGFIQGLGTGLIFVPLTTLAFATLSPAFRNEGSAMYTLIRNLGSSIGISVLSAMNIRNAAIVHARLAANFAPSDPLIRNQLAGLPVNPDLQLWEQLQNSAVTRQATMTAYIDGFWFLFIITLCAMPLILLMRPRRHSAEPVAVHLD
jgi:DHA2 family multidrug resistance protein